MTSPWAVTGPLPWSPPTLSSPRLVTLGDTAASRQITLSAGQDCLITAPTVLTDYSMVGWQDALVQVKGGRNVVWIGGHVCAKRPAPTTLTVPIAAADGPGATVTVASAASLPAPLGIIRVDGEAIEYNAISGNVLTIAKRNATFFNSTPVSSSTTHAAGATVYVGENNRSGITFSGQTGTVHLEGLQVDGFVCDAVRLTGGSAGTVQLQNCRLGPNTNYDLAYETDGHPDSIQTYSGGFATVKAARCSLLVGPNGNGILNQGISPQVGAFTLQDTEIRSAGRDRSLVVNIDVSTAWTVSNVWMRSTDAVAATRMVNDHANNLRNVLQYAQVASGQAETVPAAALAGYVSPGYAA